MFQIGDKVLEENVLSQLSAFISKLPSLIYDAGLISDRSLHAAASTMLTNAHAAQNLLLAVEELCITSLLVHKDDVAWGIVPTDVAVVCESRLALSHAQGEATALAAIACRGALPLEVVADVLQSRMDSLTDSTRIACIADACLALAPLLAGHRHTHGAFATIVELLVAVVRRIPGRLPAVSAQADCASYA